MPSRARHFARDGGPPPGNGGVRFRPKEELPPAAEKVESPYDPEARYSSKRGHSWIGYKVHLTETCEDDQVHLLTHVQTTPAPVADVECTEAIQQGLAQRELLPEVQLMDTGYVEAERLVSSKLVSSAGPTE